jgi:hypothetical protein
MLSTDMGQNDTKSPEHEEYRTRGTLASPHHRLARPARPDRPDPTGLIS